VKHALILHAPMLLLPAILYCGWRALRMFGAWRLAVATVWKSGYGEFDQQDDCWNFGFTLATRRVWTWRDGENARLIEDEVVFADAKGARHRARVERRVARGRRPSNIYTIWYDPARPEAATTFGPGYWLLLMAIWACLLASAWTVGAQFTGG
jgi:hypothetical protein